MTQCSTHEAHFSSNLLPGELYKGPSSQNLRRFFILFLFIFLNSYTLDINTTSYTALTKKTMARHYLFLAALMAAKTISAATTLFTTATAPATTTAPSASTTQIKLYVIGSTQSVPQFTGLAGSIVDANAVATTIAIDCSDGGSDCDGISWPITAIQGPSTRGGSFVVQTEVYGVEATVTYGNNCEITGTTQAATCTETIGVNAQDTSSTTTTTVSASGTDIAIQSLLITAGVDKLNRPQATETPTGAAPAAVTGHMGLTFGGAAAVAAAAALL